MLRIDMILSIIAVPVFLVATAVNGLAAWRNGRQRFGPMMIFILMATISLWYALGYGLLAAGFFPDSDPPLSVILLRPVTLFTGFVFTVIPSYLLTITEEKVSSERIEEALTKSKECQDKLRFVQARLLNQEQAVEAYQTAYNYMKDKLKTLQAEYDKLKDERT